MSAKPEGAVVAFVPPFTAKETTRERIVETAKSLLALVEKGEIDSIVYLARDANSHCWNERVIDGCAFVTEVVGALERYKWQLIQDSN